MKKLFGLMIATIVCSSGCNNQPDSVKTAVQQDVAVPLLQRVDGSKYVNNFGLYWQYKQTSLRFYEDFTPLDTSLHKISTDLFYENLATGKYIALRVPAEKSFLQLYALPDSTTKAFKTAIIQFAKDDQIRFKMEGKPISPYNFTDVNGKKYTPKDTKGKILVIKCWFISCQPCREEMPALNEMVSRYANRNDILFVSLAIDAKPELVSFLKTTKFDYAVVPDQEPYMREQLHVAGYPTHILIDRNGNVVKVVNDASLLNYFLEKEIKKSE